MTLTELENELKDIKRFLQSDTSVILSNKDKSTDNQYNITKLESAISTLSSELKDHINSDTPIPDLSKYDNKLILLESKIKFIEEEIKSMTPVVKEDRGIYIVVIVLIGIMIKFHLFS
jgi:hypothetical protein